VNIQLDLLKDKTSDLARMLDFLPVCISIADFTIYDQPLVYVNEPFCELTGYAREEVIGRNCRFLQGPRTDPSSIHMMRQATKSGVSLSLDLINYTKDRKEFINRLQLAPIFDDQRALVAYCGVQVHMELTSVEKSAALKNL